MPPRQRSLLALAVLVCLPLAASAQLFVEDFDDGTADGFTPIGPGWMVAAGVYQCETFGFEVYSSSVFGDPTWADYSVSFAIRSTDSANHLLRFRVVDFEDYYVVNLRSEPWNDVELARVMNSERTVIGLAPVAMASGIWHEVTVMAAGFQFEVYLDGVPVLSVADPVAPARLMSGQCAVVCYSGGYVEHQLVEYDDIVVEELTVAVDQVTLSSVKNLFQ